VVPATLLIIFVLLYLIFARFDEALLIMATLPFALTGGVWLLYLMDFNLSVATGVGFIALAGVAAEFGVIMLLYLKNARGSSAWRTGRPANRICWRRFARARCCACGPRP
jgi:Cu(I)/Ag(I) efflux system membrane protein CusA/SilA